MSSEEDDITSSGNCDGIDFRWMNDDDDHSADEDDRIINRHGGGHLPYYNRHERSIFARYRWIILRTPRTRIHVCLVYIIIKVLLCALYVLRVCLDDVDDYACSGSPCNASEMDMEGSGGFTSTKINWYVLLWIHRPLPLWVAMATLSLISFIMHAVLLFITSKGRLGSMVLKRYIWLECLCCLPMILSVAWPPMFQHLFIPLFLNCWLALTSLRRLLVSRN
ncbi:hypothetical protein EGW08_011006 [Elysia chlorotica]|uniref:Uncharacterized protein n=1 Tax=Elysia chlorotica TaxID=188477 RepID=A0A433TI01_ELYCH|nr:hypothetical protein EGW08_011006 [Elysia chlorotica]